MVLRFIRRLQLEFVVNTMVFFSLNNRTKFHIPNTPTKFSFGLQTSSKFIVDRLKCIDAFLLEGKINAPVCDPVSVCGDFFIFSSINEANDKKTYDNHYKH